MSMIPIELLTLGGSTVLSAILKIMAERSRAMSQLMTQRHEQTVELASAGTEGYRWTRRTIAVLVVVSVIVLPKLAALFGVPVVYGSTEAGVSLLWGLFGTGSTVEWYSIVGVPITPLDVHIGLAVAGLYFGQSIAGNKR